MRIIVSDSSCIIDLGKSSLIRAVLQLPYTFVMPDVLFEDELLNFMMPSAFLNKTAWSFFRKTRYAKASVVFVVREQSQVVAGDLIQWAQMCLRAAGFEPGSIDGRLGPQTEAALLEYQRTYRLPQSGLLDEATLRSLLPERTQELSILGQTEIYRP